MTEFSRFDEYRGHQVIEIPGDLFDRGTRYAVLEHFVEPVPCGSHRSRIGVRAEIDRCCAADLCSAGKRQLDSAAFGIMPPQARGTVQS